MTYTRKEQIGDCTLYLGDCLDVMPMLGRVDAVVTDPPYGIGMDGGNVGYKGANNFEKKSWDSHPPPQEVFDLMLSISDSQIIWGGNYFNLLPTRCFLIWDKGAGFKSRSYAECEEAWTSLDENARIFNYDPLARGDYKGKLHPTQKPVPLMAWCLGFIPKALTVLDPYMGSASTGIACIKLGRKFIGIERDEQYFDVACERIRRAYAEDMFIPQPKKAEQISLLEGA